MLGLLVEFEIIDGKGADFEDAMRRISAISAAEDADYDYYSVARVSDDPVRYLVMERFADQAALDAHGANPRIAAVLPDVNSCLSGPPVMRHVEFLT